MRRTSAEVADSRAETLDAAVRVASIIGLEGLTIGRLAAELQMSKSGLVGRFGSKQQLQLAALESASDIFRRAVYDPAATEPPGLRRLRAICEAWIGYLAECPFPGGCFLTTASVEFDARSGPVHDAVSSTMRRWVGVLAREARVAAEGGELTVDTDPDDVAFTINALAIGANCAYQLDRDPDTLARARRAMEHCLGPAATVSRSPPAGRGLPRSNVRARERGETMATTTTQTGTATTNGGGGRTITVENPATGETVAELSALGRDGAIELVNLARAAQPGWNALGFSRRAAYMKDMRAWMVANRERFIDTLAREAGKPYEDAQLELFYCVDALGFWAKRAEKWLADERERPHSPLLAGRKVVNRYVPYGAVGVIGPWNYPLINNFGDAIPALMAGNTVVLKPASITPLSSLLVAEGLAEVGLPEHVFSVALGSGGEVGGALADTVDMLHFTGSTEVGKTLAERGARRLLPITLELGGNDPMIVLRDANLERAANAAVFGALQNAGQTCISVERVYVEGDAYEPFVEKVVAKVNELRQGVPQGRASVDIGAVTSPEQIDILQAHISDAVQKGAQVRTGGRQKPGGGAFWEPTVLTGVDHSMRIMTEETFGPTLPIMRVESEEEAIRLANDSEFGLDSSVFAGDPAHAEAVARRLESGSSVINDALVNYFAMEIPIGGMKQSGVGARHGRVGIQKYCQRQNLVVTRFGMNRELYYFPYTKFGSKLTELMIRALYGRGSGRR